jgi:hypothetical protein
MTYKKITDPKDLIVGKLYSDLEPTSPIASIMKFTGFDKKTKELKFKGVTNCDSYGSDKLRFDNPAAMPFYELPDDYINPYHIGTTNPTDFPTF